MTITDIDPTIREYLYAWECLRRLGFPADDIYIAVYPSGTMVENGLTVHHSGPIIQLELRTQGLEWKWTIGATRLRSDVIEHAYELARSIWNSGALADAFEQEFRRSRPIRMGVQLIQSLIAKGLKIPNPPQGEPDVRSDN